MMSTVSARCPLLPVTACCTLSWAVSKVSTLFFFILQPFLDNSAKIFDQILVNFQVQVLPVLCVPRTDHNMRLSIPAPN